MNSLTVFAPAKINLFLAITGRRPDGFHDLISVVAPLTLGDKLSLEIKGGEGTYSLVCDDADVPVDESNLVLRATRLYAAASGWKSSIHFRLTKRIPIGAGLGGGSSDGTSALLGLNQLNPAPLDRNALHALAAQLGSDCVLFLQGSPCVMRGRGEQIEVLPADVATRIRGRRLVVFKPFFGISTAWAYQQMASTPTERYVPAAWAEARLAAWRDTPAAGLEQLIANNMESAAFAKFVALPTLLNQLRTQFQVAAGMSGSGSACYALLPENTPVEPIISSIRAAWGNSAFICETRFG